MLKRGFLAAVVQCCVALAAGNLPSILMSMPAASLPAGPALPDRGPIGNNRHARRARAAIKRGK